MEGSITFHHLLLLPAVLEYTTQIQLSQLKSSSYGLSSMPTCRNPLPTSRLFEHSHSGRGRSYCDTKRSCCYPTTGKPDSDFSIHGLWPNNRDGSYPTNCDLNSQFDSFAVSNLTSRMQADWPTLACPSGNGVKFWTHEWVKHGTCSESVLNQRAYFETTLDLKMRFGLLSILKNAGIEPDGSFYSLNDVSEAIRETTGFTPGIQCNRDASRNSQLYEIYMCVDTSGSNFIECPVLPRTRCSSRIEFPAF